jgi:hypothetical protein
MERGKDAVTVIRNAMPLASSPQETAMAENFLRHAEEYAQAQEQSERFAQQLKAATPVTETDSRGAEVRGSAVHDEALPNGPHHFVTGVLKDVHCNTPAIDLNVIAAGKTLGLHSGNYFKIEYSTLGVALKKNLNPCADLEGKPAKVEYVDSAGKGPAAVMAIEIHK